MNGREAALSLACGRDHGHPPAYSVLMRGVWSAWIPEEPGTRGELD